MKVGVIMGGISSEREVSIKSGQSIVELLDKEKYEVIPIVIDKKEDIIEKAKGIDFALLALHGKFGEDGTVQAVLQTMDIPYSGCGILSSAICMDKDMTKKVLKSCDIRTAKWYNVTSVDEIDYEKIDEIGYPVVIKPNSGGSSVATFIIKNKEEVKNAVAEGLKWDNEVMIEEYVKGDEITCPILDGKMLPVLAIKPKSDFFDYTSKYADGGADEFIVELEENLHKEVEDLAIRTYKALKCSVYGRVDMIVSNGVPYVLEVNTLSGMTKNSLFPRSAIGVGISFTKLLDLIIENSLKVRG
ncbi:D-alanine--D-alanine ligase [Clostridium fallax]|uniref:D-alanine--D-alanine ligase n=1 Tax=Clostridium fallax TaxID=1533 RepID=A0A1M4SR28_9CLOT|nr:D-alanine--D-alanine ligase [Clostridium fallax]SHE34622.1 D-alanine--D-alanine ligase [Clostridium fallax]SQB07934.1 D-alanine--D-alanine ligase [Clostridium fallax]